MRKHPQFWPNLRNAQLALLNTLRKAIGEVGVLLGLTLAEIASFQTDIIFYIWHLQVWLPAVELYNNEQDIYKEQLDSGGAGIESILVQPTPPVFTDCPEMRTAGVLVRIFSVITRIRKAEGYNEAIAKILGLQRPPAVVSDRPCPQLFVKLEQGAGRKRVRTDFRKYGHDGVVIRCRRNGGEWEPPEVDNSSPHYDDRPLLVENVPETREYSARFWDKGEAHGEWSPPVVISVIP